MAYISSVEVFKNLILPRSGYRQVAKCSYTAVGEVYKKMFSKFSVEPWTDFDGKAAKVMVEKKAYISATKYNSYKCFDENLDDMGTISSEAGLATPFTNHLVQPANAFLQSSSQKWGISNRTTKDSNFRMKTPDFSLRSERGGSSSSQTRDMSDRLLAVGDLKTPCVNLGSAVTAAGLTRDMHAKDSDKNVKLSAFFQIFSYILHSEKGVGFLSNHDHTRYFKINLKKKKLLMSPLVRIDQVLDEKKGIPHPIQTFLYMKEVGYPSSDELSTREAERLLQEAADELDKEERDRSKKEEAAKKEAAKKDSGASSSKQKKSKGGGSSSGNKGGKKKTDLDSEEVFSAVSRVMRRCKVIGNIGYGMTGDVQECDFDGTKVAVKAGLPFEDRYDDQDCFAHVKREIKNYEVLKELQGSVIPRVVIAGLERCYTPSAMVLITEKVGKAVEERDNKLFIGEKELSREDLIVMKEKGLRGLERMHGCGVVHLDTVVRNTRVELRDGKVDRVWWIDLGSACEIEDETEKVYYEEEGMGRFLIYYKTGAMEVDRERYASDIDEYLKHAESSGEEN